MADPLTVFLGYKAAKVAIFCGVWVFGYLVGRADERQVIVQSHATAQPKPSAPPITIEAKPVSVAKKAVADTVSTTCGIPSAVSEWAHKEPLFARIRNARFIAEMTARFSTSPQFQWLAQSLLPCQLLTFLAHIPVLSLFGPGLLFAVLVGGGFLLASKLLSGRLAFLAEFFHVHEDVKELGRLTEELVRTFVPFAYPLRV